MDEFLHNPLQILEAVLSIVFGVMGILIIWGFWPLAWGPRGTLGVRSLARAVLLLSLAVVIRILYYSGVFVSIETIVYVGKNIPNILTSSILIFGGYYMLRVLYLTIPEAERSGWSLVTAPFYPRKWRKAFSKRLEEFIENAKGEDK